MIVLEVLLLAFLVFCALATVLGKKMVSSIIIFMSYSAVMSILWFLLESLTWPSPRPPWGRG